VAIWATVRRKAAVLALRACESARGSGGLLLYGDRPPEHPFA
jgi:hypothetical protein